MHQVRGFIEIKEGERQIRWGVLYLVFSVLAIALYYALTGTLQEVFYNFFGFFAVACILFGIWYHRPSWPLPWALIATGILVLKAGDIVYSNHEALFGRPLPFPSLAEGLFFVGNTIIFLALALVLRSREPHQDSGNVIDAAIIATTAATLAWIFIMAPYASDESLTNFQLIAVLATPLYDLITIVLLTRLIFGTGLRTPSFYLLLGGMASCLVADVLYSEIALHTTFESGDLLDAGWIGWFLLYGAAALHPSMARIGEPGSSQPARLSSNRLVLLTGAALMVPAVAFIQWQRDIEIDIPVVIGASAITFVLVVLRMTGLVHAAEAARRDLRRSLEREQVMRQTSQSLVSASSASEVYQSAAGAAVDLIGDHAIGFVLDISGEGSLDLVAESRRRDRGLRTRRLPAAVVPLEAREGLDRGAPQILNVTDCEQLWSSLRLPPELSAAVLAPVTSEQRQVAVLGLATARDDHREVGSQLTALSSQVSLALERVSLSEQLHTRRSEERFHSLVQNASDVILILTGEGEISYASPSVNRVFGTAESSLVGADIFRLIHADDALAARAFFNDVVSQPGTIKAIDLRMRAGSGDWRSMEVTFNNLLADPGLLGVVANARDVTERKLAEEELSHQAWHDPLTNLPNRARFMELLGREIQRAHAGDSLTAVLFIDLDRFKLVNDSLGHEAGDALLREAGRRIRNEVRPDDMVARLGGDEFTVFISDVEDPGEPVDIAERLLGAFSKPLLIGEREVFVDASIGIAMVTNDVTEPGELLRRADIAMYQAKETGGQSVAVFDEEMGSNLLMRLELETDLRHAIERGQLELFFQPEVDLATHRFNAAEALLRWNHPRLGAVPPTTFVPLAEETGLILEIGRWVLQEAARTAAGWFASMPDLDLTISVNLSVRQYLHPGIVTEIAEIVGENAIPPNRLRLEITETILMDEKTSSRDVLEDLDDLNIQLAIDDFGSGYSNLGYLKRLPVETLKIDQIFIKGLGQDPHDSAIVRAITELAHRIGLRVTAEGVETAEQLALVREIGCDSAQGFLFARPMPAADLTRILELDLHVELPEVSLQPVE